jgi:hypothetical protein
MSLAWSVQLMSVGSALFQVFKYLDSLDVEDFKDVKSGYSINFVSVFFLIYCHMIWLMLGSFSSRCQFDIPITCKPAWFVGW